MKRLSKAEQFKDDMERCRGMGWVSLGMMVESDGHLGTIVGMNRSANLDVVFVNQLKWGAGKHNCHPTWETRYFDADGKVIKDYRRTAGRPQANGCRRRRMRQKTQQDRSPTHQPHGVAAMLRTPLQLQQMPKTQFDFTVPYTLRDRCGHVLGGSFSAGEGDEVRRRCNAYDALVLALRTIRDTDLQAAQRHAVADQALAIAGEP